MLQQDAWEDLNGWEGYLRTSIESLLPSPTPRIVRPVAPEYLSGVYADCREQQLEYMQWKEMMFGKQEVFQRVITYQDVVDGYARFVAQKGADVERRKSALSDGGDDWYGGYDRW